MSNIDAIKEIVGVKYMDDWIPLNPKVFYKDNKPHGLIATHGDLVLATTKHFYVDFSKEMIKYIMCLNKKQDIVLVTDHKPSFDKIKKLLSKRGFEFKVIDGVLLSRRDRWE